MKFSLFVHMERLNAQQNHKDLYDEFIDLCVMADQGGFDAIWTGEHHGMDFTIAPNPFINIADLARRTKNVRLGTGTVIAPFWHPIKLAGEAAMTDIISGGRLDVGHARSSLSNWATHLAHVRCSAKALVAVTLPSPLSAPMTSSANRPR
jgi:alkanesulfonate monooxygenase SsuD/methylene tetrahydromethanopterin reductase-like flavin-dependent oxidoreductase (luciferase family)